MRVLALDVGDKRIGVAISDPEEIIARPLAVIPRNDDKSAIDAVSRLVEQYDIKLIIVGLPYSLDGSLGLQADKVKSFTDMLSRSVNARIEFRDERLSTVASQRLLNEAGNKRSAKSPRDDAAAAYILQGYLDSPKVGDR
jgi:putative pre-16S rRNA nuclease